MGKSKTSCEVIYFCDGKKCCRYNSEAKSCIKNLLKETGLCENITLEKIKCQGMCKKAPVFYLNSQKKYKKEVTVKKAKKMLDKYIVA